MACAENPVPSYTQIHTGSTFPSSPFVAFVPIPVRDLGGLKLLFTNCWNGFPLHHNVSHQATERAFRSLATCPPNASLGKPSSWLGVSAPLNQNGFGSRTSSAVDEHLYSGRSHWIALHDELLPDSSFPNQVREICSKCDLRSGLCRCWWLPVSWDVLGVDCLQKPLDESMLERQSLYRLRWRWRPAPVPAGSTTIKARVSWTPSHTISALRLDHAHS